MQLSAIVYASALCHNNMRWCIVKTKTQMIYNIDPATKPYCEVMLKE